MLRSLENVEDGSGIDSESLSHSVDIESISMSQPTLGQNENSDDGSSSTRNIDSQNIPNSYKISDARSNSLEIDDASSLPFPAVFQMREELFVIQILEFMTAKDLGKIAKVCKSFNRATLTKHLWRNLIKMDFAADEQIDNDGLSLISDPTYRSAITLSTAIIPSKALYIRRYNELKQRIQQCKESYLQLNERKKQEHRIYFLQWLLDITQVRILGPFFIFSIFLFILLISLKFDNYNIPTWGVFFPIYLFLFYLSISSCITYIIYRFRYSSSSLISSLWNNLRGPLRFYFVNILVESKPALKATILALALFMIQVILIILKLLNSDNSHSTMETHISNSLDWGIVFIPIWLLFLLGVLMPYFGCFRGSGGPNVYALFLIFLWLPFLILFAFLTMKLTVDEKSHHKSTIRLALILVPFWCFEGLIMTFTLGLLIFGYFFRYRAGLQQRLDEYIGLVLLTWIGLSPFVVFQALLCARDDGYTQTVTAAEAVTPLLLLLGWLLLCAITYAINYRTPFQESLTERMQQNSSGNYAWFDV